MSDRRKDVQKAWEKSEVDAAEKELKHKHRKHPMKMKLKPVKEDVYDIGPGHPDYVSVGYMDTPSRKNVHVGRRKKATSKQKQGENQK